MERSDQLSVRSDSSSGDDEHLQRERRSKFRVASLLNELFACGDDYPEYKLVSNKGSYQDLSKHVYRFQNTIDVQMQPHVLSGTDLIAVLSFLAKLGDVSSLSRVPDFTEVWGLQSYVEGQAESILLNRLTESLMAVNSKRPRKLQA